MKKLVIAGLAVAGLLGAPAMGPSTAYASAPVPDRQAVSAPRLADVSFADFGAQAVASMQSVEPGAVLVEAIGRVPGGSQTSFDHGASLGTDKLTDWTFSFRLPGDRTGVVHSGNHQSFDAPQIVDAPLQGQDFAIPSKTDIVDAASMIYYDEYRGGVETYASVSLRWLNADDPLAQNNGAGPYFVFNMTDGQSAAFPAARS